jgi:Arc/MetJ family transcription regulator
MTEPAKSKGCPAVIILIVLAVLALLAIPALAFLMYFMKRNAVHEEIQTREVEVSRAMAAAGLGAEGHAIHFQEGQMPRLSAEIGDELSSKAFVAFEIDANATSLTKEAFVQSANGRTVRWLLSVSNIEASDEGDGLEGDFALPYYIHRDNGYSGSSVSVRAFFPGGEKTALSRLRREDWVTIEGRLELKEGCTAVLRDAKVVGAER